MDEGLTATPKPSDFSTLAEDVNKEEVGSNRVSELSLPPPPPVPGAHVRAGSMNDLDRKNAIEVMELSDMHHPSCKLSQSRQGSFDDEADDDDRSPLHDMSTHSHHSHHSHHSCHSAAAGGHPHPPTMPVGGGTRRDSDLSDAFLSPEAYRATQAVEFIAEHLRNEDEYVQVRFIM